MQAFHNDPAIKAKYVARLKAHHAADEVIQGAGSHGRTLGNYSHAAYPNELELPEWLAWLEDRIFEGLPAKEAQQFAVDFLDAIPVGADVSDVRRKLAIARAQKTLPALQANREPYARECESAVMGVIAYLKDLAARSAADSAAWSARSAAASAARSAADSAADSAWSARSAADSAAWSARSAADSAAWSAWSAARSAARSAADSAAWSAWSAAWSTESTESDHYRFEAKTLIALLKECTSS